MRVDLDFESKVIDSVLGGVSVLDIPRLNVKTEAQAKKFAKGYGFDLDSEEDLQRVWNFHTKAITLIREELLVEGEEVPELLSDSKQLKDISHLLIYASTQDNETNPLQKWACALLRVMHVFVHLENDLFSIFTGDIQDQVLRPIEAHIFRDPAGGIYLGSPQSSDSIRLEKFEVKPFKTSRSSVIKLLAKPDAVALNLLDKMGVRFVTPHLIDTFRVIRYMVEHGLISYPQIMPDQSNNTLYPNNLFIEVMGELKQSASLHTLEEIDAILDQRLIEVQQRAEFKEKPNHYSSKDYRFAKFIERQLISVKLKEGEASRTIRFFFPFEVQLTDRETHLKNLTGQSSHDEYKKRQKTAARRRVFGIGNI